MGSSAPTVINHLPGMQGIVISHSSVQLVLHPHTTAASQLGHPWINHGGSRRAVGTDPGERGLEPDAECRWCCEAIKHRDFGGSSRGNWRYLLSECFLLKQVLKRFRMTAKHLVTAVILSNIQQPCVNCL